MAPIGTVWGAAYQPQTKVILSVAALNELELRTPEWKFTDRPAEFTAKFTYGKIPAFEGADGFKLTEGLTIARYLSALGTKVNLLGSDTKEIALIDQWVHFSETELGVPGYVTMGMVYGFSGTFNRETFDKHIERLVRALDHVESYLATRSSGYLVSDSLTLADLALAGTAYLAAQVALGAAERAKYPLVYGHYARVTGNDKVKHLWGTEGFAEAAIKEPKRLPTESY